jgi:lipopolysaccharide transport system ATP-binding protein
MTRKEIDRKFDEIVDFSGVERFLDTPVKHYSSGMYMRLAFAVAAHLDSEILVVDEVLAVGDVEFQKKCLGKMEDISKNEGRTVLFVSHNMSAITSMCTQAIVLESGQITFNGKTSDSVLYYLTNGSASQNFFDYSKRNKVIGDKYTLLLSGSIRNLNGKLISEVNINESFKICMEFEILKETKRKFLPQMHFFTSGTHVFAEYYQSPLKLSPGKYHVEFSIPANFLNDLTYFIALSVTTTDLDSIVHFYDADALSFNVKDPIENTPGPRLAGYAGEVPGVIRPQFKWTINKV